MKFKIGILVIGVSFLIALNPFLFYYAIPIFTLGVLLLWLSSENLFYKIAWTIAPIVLWYPCMELFVKSYLSFQEMTHPRYDFIFPANFSGTALIIENMPCAGNSKKQNGRILLEFPEIGILLYSTRIESSYLDNKYYRKDSIGNLTELLDFHWDLSDNDKSGQEKSGVTQRYSAVGNLYLPERYIYTYDVLTVGLIDDSDSIIISQDKIKKLETIVKNCFKDKMTNASH